MSGCEYRPGAAPCTAGFEDETALCMSGLECKVALCTIGFEYKAALRRYSGQYHSTEDQYNTNLAQNTETETQDSRPASDYSKHDSCPVSVLRHDSCPASDYSKHDVIINVWSDIETETCLLPLALDTRFWQS